MPRDLLSTNLKIDVNGINNIRNNTVRAIYPDEIVKYDVILTISSL